MTVRIAMWSGPRNISTSMMRSFGARADTTPVDEPFYAAYLKATGRDHPMAEAVLAAGECDPERAATALMGPVSTPYQYQKQMTQHLLPGFPRGWMHTVRHAFLIRHPARVIASFAAKYDRVDLASIGFTQQYEIIEQVADQHPVIIDADDILAAPEAALKALCTGLDIAWDPAMLRWEAGAKAEDGVWGAHWYGAVAASTGFGPPPGPVPTLNGVLADLAAQALPIYQQLHARRLSIGR